MFRTVWEILLSLYTMYNVLCCHSRNTFVTSQSGFVAAPNHREFNSQKLQLSQMMSSRWLCQLSAKMILSVSKVIFLKTAAGGGGIFKVPPIGGWGRILKCVTITSPFVLKRIIIISILTHASGFLTTHAAQGHGAKGGWGAHWTDCQGWPRETDNTHSCAHLILI